MNYMKESTNQKEKHASIFERMSKENVVVAVYVVIILTSICGMIYLLGLPVIDCTFDMVYEGLLYVAGMIMLNISFLIERCKWLRQKFQKRMRFVISGNFICGTGCCVIPVMVALINSTSLEKPKYENVVYNGVVTRSSRFRTSSWVETYMIDRGLANEFPLDMFDEEPKEGAKGIMISQRGCLGYTLVQRLYIVGDRNVDRAVVRKKEFGAMYTDWDNKGVRDYEFLFEIVGSHELFKCMERVRNEKKSIIDDIELGDTVVVLTRHNCRIGGCGDVYRKMHEKKINEVRLIY